MGVAARWRENNFAVGPSTVVIASAQRGPLALSKAPFQAVERLDQVRIKILDPVPEPACRLAGLSTPRLSISPSTMMGIDDAGVVRA
jgi:hypothetical protein